MPVRRSARKSGQKRGRRNVPKKSVRRGLNKRSQPFYVDERVADAFPSTLHWNDLSRQVDRNRREREELDAAYQRNDRGRAEPFYRAHRFEDREEARNRDDGPSLLQKIVNFFRPSHEQTTRRHHSPRRGQSSKDTDHKNLRDQFPPPSFPPRVPAWANQPQQPVTGHGYVTFR